MIRFLQHGTYSLFLTKGQIRILNIDERKTFVWRNKSEIGEILTTIYEPHRADHVLFQGKYRLYEVRDEPGLTDFFHLELLVGCGRWEGYLLPAGLPNGKSRRNKIIPTREVITKVFI